MIARKIKLTLVGLEGDAPALLGAFSRQAWREGWTKDEIDAVVTTAMSGDYDHLLRTLIDHCEEAEDD